MSRLQFCFTMLCNSLSLFQMVCPMPREILHGHLQIQNGTATGHAGSQHRSRRSETCSDPHQTELHQNWTDRHSSYSPWILHPSHHLTPAFQRFISDELQLSSTAATFVVSGNNDFNCAQPPPITAETPLSERAICPWYFVVNYNTSRYPHSLLEAQCSCTGCIGDTSGTSGCEMTYYNVPVLQRTTTCSNGQYVWDEGFQPLATGCTCGRTPGWWQKTVPDIISAFCQFLPGILTLY